MPINQNYDEAAVVAALASALEEFYRKLVEKLDNVKLSDVVKRKNPYLFRAKAITNASEIVELILSATVSSSEETIFGNVFFEPIAKIASQGQKALAEGVDIIVEKSDVIYAIAVKSGPNIFNADSRKRQEQNFAAARKLATQAKKRFEAIIGCGYGKKKSSHKGLAKIYRELAGQEFWTELTGDEQFYLKIARLMGETPEKYVDRFRASYSAAANRLTKEFVEYFCEANGMIAWEKLIRYNSGLYVADR